jgi:hypothetical protein
MPDRRYCRCNGGAGGIGVVSLRLGPHAAGRELRTDAPTPRAALDFARPCRCIRGLARGRPSRGGTRKDACCAARQKCRPARRGATGRPTGTASVQLAAKAGPDTALPTVAADFVLQSLPPRQRRPLPPDATFAEGGGTGGPGPGGACPTSAANPPLRAANVRSRPLNDAAPAASGQVWAAIQAARRKRLLIEVDPRIHAENSALNLRILCGD